MCGIVYSKSFNGKPVNATIENRYLDQKHRGREGFGFYIPETNQLLHNPKEYRALTHLRRAKKATSILWHHRMPTSTENVRNACHPFSTKDHFKHNYVVVHNGVLWNEPELKKVHDSLGIKYVSEQPDGSFNDSEALAYDIARYLEGDVGFITAEGSIAFIAIQRSKKGKELAVYFGRNEGNPLVLKRTKKSFTLSSEGFGEIIDPNTMYRLDSKTGALTRSPCRFPSYKAAPYTYPQDFDISYQEDNDDWDNGYGGDSLRARRYFTDEEVRERSFAKYERDRLEYEANYDLNDALELGEAEIDRLMIRIDYLKDRVEIMDIGTDAEQDEYYTIDNQLYYLKQAVEDLRKEVSGQSQIGFRYTGDHHDYGDWNKSRVRERAYGHDV